MVRNLFLLATVFCLQISLHAQQSVATSAARLRGFPISFEVNHGQVDSQVRYLAHAGNGTIYFTPAETVLTLLSQNSEKKPELSVLRLKWIGANSSPQMSAEHPLPGKINYLIGHDPSQWHTGIPTYERVPYRGLFPGVDAVFYGKESKIEYDLVLAPGVDPARVSFALEGAGSLQIANNGDLGLRLQNAEVRQHKPVVYQENNGVRRLLSARYVIHRDQTVSYEVAGVDRKLPLVIDPTLSYSTFASNGSNAHIVSSVAVDQSGNAYVTGTTTVAFPNRHPQFGSQVGQNAYVTKFSPTGSSVIYSTIFGGNSFDEGIAIAID